MIRSFLAYAGFAVASHAFAAEPSYLGDFPGKVRPFLTKHCVKCHGGEKPKGELSLAAISGDILDGKDVAKWVAMAERLMSGDMPPEGEKQPAPDAIKAVTDWIDAELAKAGKKGELKAGSLKTGNHVPHELLFDPKAEFPLDNPPRLWRISPFIYQATAKDINKNLKLSQPFSLPAGDGFKDQCGAAGIDASTLAQLLRNATTIRKFNFELIACLVKKLQAVPEGNGTMWDNTLVVYLSDAAEGHHSGCWEWPVVLLGNMGGAIKAGRYLEMPGHGAKHHKHIGNLYTTLLHAAGDKRETFGQPDPILGRDVDQKGPIAELLV